MASRATLFRCLALILSAFYLFFCFLGFLLQAPRRVGDLDIPDSKRAELVTICNNVKYRTLERYLTVFSDGRVFVATGDIDDMWIRDSTIQMRPFMHVKKMKPLMEGFIKTLAFYLLQDPYANSFRKTWSPRTEGEAGLRRGGWVATGNWEPDSISYFYHFLCDFGEPKLFEDSVVAAAVDLTLDTLIIEQNHANSNYTYSELRNHGRGDAFRPVGLVWGAFRPSDDMQVHPFNIPVNMHLHSALTKLKLHYKPGYDRIMHIRLGIEVGVHHHGIVDGMYAYEVDGLGNALLGFDDANLPSLLSAPLSDYLFFNNAVYQKTRKYLLSPQNPYFFTGPSFEGIGSPHTRAGHVWPLAVMARALTSDSPIEIRNQLYYLLSMQCNTATMHESVSVSDTNSCTRTDFEWANTLFVETIQKLFPGSCTLADFDLNKIKHA